MSELSGSKSQEPDQPLETMLEKLAGLSGRFGAEAPVSPFVISKDVGYENVAGTIKQRFKDHPADLGVFVGSGGILSLLPDLNLQAAVMIDRSRSVVEFTQFLSRVITISESSAEAWQRLSDIDNMDPELIKYLLRLGGLPLIDVHDEARVYGIDHWTAPARFLKVKEALAQTPIVPIASDLTSPQFQTSFSEILNRHGHHISFANLTNVATEPFIGNADFIDQWPFDNKLLILFSKFGKIIGGKLEMRTARSVEDYKAEALNLPTPEN